MDQKRHKSNYSYQNRKSNVKVFFFKQLADVIESVAGAVSKIGGLNVTQDYLRNIKVL